MGRTKPETHGRGFVKEVALKVSCNRSNITCSDFDSTLILWNSFFHYVDILRAGGNMKKGLFYCCSG